MRWFDVHEGNVDDRVVRVKQNIRTIAYWLDDNLPDGAEKTVALRRLLDAKDAACRAALE
jgi:hypothetical protein